MHTFGSPTAPRPRGDSHALPCEQPCSPGEDTLARSACTRVFGGDGFPLAQQFFAFHFWLQTINSAHC